jgi:hypothetical protein
MLQLTRLDLLCSLLALVQLLREHGTVLLGSLPVVILNES